MLKKDFFLQAMKAEEFRRRAFVISAFTQIDEAPDAWRKKPYPFRIVQTQTGHFFVDPKNQNELIKIDDASPGQPIFNVKEKIDLKAGEVPNLFKDITSTYGNLLVNYTVLVYALQNKIHYIEGRMNPSKLENMILPHFKDRPSLNETAVTAAPVEASDVYPDEYLKFTDALFYLAGFTQICVPAATRKSMTVSPEIAKRKKELLEQYKDQLDNPGIIALIMQELIAMDRAWFKGDDAEGFLIKGKSFDVVRAKKFLMQGAEAGFGDGVKVDLIQNSLEEGWDVTKFAAMNDTLRSGSFNRGAQTQFGGEAVKWLLRASSNMNVTLPDCGTKLGNIIHLTKQNASRYYGFSIVTEGDPVKLTKDNVEPFFEKNIIVRSPMFCKLEKTDFCQCCVGERLAANPTALSVAVSEYGSVFLALFMKAMHGKSLEVAKMDYQTAIT